MEINSRDINLIVETLRRNNFKGTKIHEIITTAWGDKRISVRRVQQVMTEFGEGRIQFDRIDGSGRPKSQKRIDLTQMVADEVTVNRRITCYELADKLDTNHRMIYDILTEDLHMRSIQDKWVPHNLSEANKEARVSCCTELIEKFTRRNIHRNLVVADEKWFFCRPVGCPQTRRSWCSADGDVDRDQIPKRLTVDRKFMAIVAVNFDGLSFSTVLERNQSVDSELYTNFLIDTVNSFTNHDLRNERREVSWENMVLMHDNARPHVSRHTQNFLADKNVQLLYQAPYSPDLNICDRMIFPALEMKRSDLELMTKESLESYLNETLTFTPQVMRRAALKLIDHCRNVIAANGNYL